MPLNEAKKGTDFIMKVNSPKFEVSAVSPKQYPKNNLPQIVLVGKSNVGKSSFINTMINRKALARTSSEPGKTRQINFYNIDNSFYFVDLPGYGYSKLSKQEQVNMGKFIEDYLEKCQNISLIIQLLDIRHDPTNDDILMLDYIKKTNLPFMLVANKADKIAVTKVDDQIKNIKEYLKISFTPLLPFSSERRIYVDDVVTNIDNFINL